MPEFRYTARSSEGSPESGVIEADSREAATRALEARGLVGVAFPEERPRGRSSSSVEGIALGLADITRAELPLEAGLRAMAEESRGARRRALLRICDRVEAGESLDDALAGVPGALPDDLVSLVRAGVRSGRVGDVLAAYVDRARTRADRRRAVVAALAYPAVLLLATIVLLVFVLTAIVPGFASIFADFGVELPRLTRLVMSVSAVVGRHPVLWMGGAIAIVFVGVAVVLGAFGGRATRRVLHAIPVIGSCIRNDAWASFCDLLSLAVRQEVPLPDALRVTAPAVGDPAVAASARQVASGLEQGTTVSDAATVAGLPVGVRQALTWSNEREALATALEAAGRNYDVRARISADLLNAQLGPFTIILVSLTVGTTVVALLVPLIQLLNNLS